MYISCAPSPAGLSGSLWGVKCMQADGGSVTCRSSSLGSVALTALDYTPALSPYLLGEKQHNLSELRSSQPSDERVTEPEEAEVH